MSERTTEQRLTWQPIETAPTDGTKFLVYTIHGDFEIGEHYALTHDLYDPVDGDLYRKRTEEFAKGWNCNNFKWWMPLPEAPK